MADSHPTVDHIDHVALDVADAEASAAWYSDLLGVAPLDGFASWAAGSGPLVISSDDGHTMLALFETDADEYAPRHIAFRTDGPGLLAFADRLADEPSVDCRGREAIVDHRLSWSIYFDDPDGHRLEITTYDYEYVAERL